MRSNPRFLNPALALAAWAAHTGAILATDHFEATSEDELVGTWTTKKGDVECAITFTAGHNFSGTLTLKTGVQTSFAGTWRLQNSHDTKYGFIPQELHYVYTDQERAGTKDMDLVVCRELVGGTQTLTFLTKGGEERIYKKSQPQAK